MCAGTALTVWDVLTYANAMGELGSSIFHDWWIEDDSTLLFLHHRSQVVITRVTLAAGSGQVALWPLGSAVGEERSLARLASRVAMLAPPLAELSVHFRCLAYGNPSVEHAHECRNGNAWELVLRANATALDVLVT